MSNAEQTKNPKTIAREGKRKKSTFDQQIVDLRWFMSMVKLKL